ncbi:MAG: tRNA (N(6)-L-threonylcarbamoyladenosine(37)-C(2))-methylthiotransferase MtaB [Desulfobacteraceae bacterium]|nr:tRNA (N(6)-L-threonylcarbamoyladenosine(37)-C(2))-methylthiotransferase MtaB [Desulfobacteraceae bacterium]
MPTYKITTLGCKVNQFEAETLAGRLEAAGYTPVPQGEPADLCIVNTCTVTRKASMQSRQMTRQFIRDNPGGKVIVTGCYAEIEPEIIRSIPGVSRVIGQADKTRIADLMVGEDARAVIGGNMKDISSPLRGGSDWRFSLPKSNRTRPFLKIQDGCNSFCTYCIVPHARGRSRSLPVNEVIDAARQLSAFGYREIVLTGIHVGNYGVDLHPKTNLTNLLEEMIRINIVRRVRLSSIEPKEITGRMIQLAAAEDHGQSTLCRHFHIPLQSGDDQVLERMGRPYDCALFRSLVSDINREIPDAGIGTDILTGFPGETEAAFENTVKLIESLPLTYLHVFPFSPRKGTPAFTYPDQVKSAVIKERANRLRRLGLEKKETFFRQQRDMVHTVLVEGTRDRNTGLLKGLTSNYIPVIFEGRNELQNTFVRVRIQTSAESNRMRGVLEIDTPPGR